jgi:hypothetical protein
MTHERTTIERALNESKDSSGEWNIGKAARALGASRRTLQNRMRHYGMKRGKAGRRRQGLPYGLFRGKKRRSAWGGAAALAGVVGLSVYLRRRGSPKA